MKENGTTPTSSQTKAGERNVIALDIDNTKDNNNNDTNTNSVEAAITATKKEM